MARDHKYGEVDVPGVPDDEPIFILRAKDAVALDTVSFYSGACIAIGCDPVHIAGIDAAHERFVEWRTENAELVSRPDTEVPAA